MIRTLFYCALFILPLFSLAQNTEGTIVFEEKVEIAMDFEIEGLEGMDEIKDMLSNMKAPQKILYFNPTASVFKTKDVDDKKEISSEDENMAIMIVMDQPEEILYHDFTEKKAVEQKEFMGKKFLIESEENAPKWKMTGEAKTVAGFECMKAVAQDEESETVAWFTPAIPVASGPQGFGNLPGMIMELSLDSGQVVYSAIDVQFAPVEEGVIVAPKKGKKVSMDEFEKIVKKKTEKMTEMQGGNKEGTFIIEIHE